MTEGLSIEILDSIVFRYRSIKEVGDRALAQLADEQLHWQPNDEANSIATIIQHLHGNMKSRWTEFLTTDGEKEWRDRDAEFTPQTGRSKKQLLQQWEEGWETCLDAIERVRPDDLVTHVIIRGQPLTVVDAMHRQMAHYAYHVGQIVCLARQQLGEKWETLSIPRGQSGEYRPTRRD